MSKQISVDPIDFEDEKQKGKTQLSTPVKHLLNGKEVIPIEETPFVYHKYSKFASSKFFTPDQRNFIKMEYYKDQKNCDVIRKSIAEYDTYMKNNRSLVLGKYDKLYTYIESVKVPVVDEEDELTQSEAKEPKEDYTKVKMNTTWSYYYKDTGLRLEKDNSIIVSKAIREALKKNKDKKNLESLVFTLSTKTEDGKVVKKTYEYNEIEERKELSTKVYIRKLPQFNDEIKSLLEKTELSEADEAKLEELCGEPTEVDVRTGEDLDKYYKGNCYVRFLIKPVKLWAARNKDETNKRKMGVQFQCLQMDIVQLPYTTTDNPVRNLYTKYSFGKNKNDVPKEIDKLLIKPDTLLDKTVVDKKTETTKKSVSKSVVVEESEEESEEEEEESEEDSEEEIEVKPVITKGKQVVKSSSNLPKKTK
jgi:hypothetical protein